MDRVTCRKIYNIIIVILDIIQPPNAHLSVLHFQCLQHRALNPDDPLPELSPVVANYLKPPQEVITRCSQTMDKMADTFKLKYVAKRKAENGDDRYHIPCETRAINKPKK